MALDVGVNSYISVEDADTYLGDRLNTELWFSAETVDKSKALISATDLQENLCIWSYEKTNPDQSLEFPRGGDIEVPYDIIESQLSIALEMTIQGISSFKQSSQILTGLKAGSLNMSLTDEQSDVNTILTNTTKSILSRYGTCSFNSANGIQMVNVIR